MADDAIILGSETPDADVLVDDNGNELKYEFVE